MRESMAYKSKIKYSLALETIEDSLEEGKFSVVTEKDGGMTAIRDDGKKIALSGARASLMIKNLSDSYTKIRLKTGEIALVPKGVGYLPFKDDTTHYNELVGMKIIEEILNGITLSVICKSPGFPSRASISRWFIEEPEFKKAYEYSKKVQAEFYESELIELADNSGLTKEEISKTKLQVDSRKTLTKALKAGWGEREVYSSDVILSLNYDPKNPKKPVILDQGVEITQEAYSAKYSLDSPENLQVKEDEGEENK